MKTLSSFNRIDLFTIIILFVNIYASFSTLLPIAVDTVAVFFLFIRNRKSLFINKYQYNLLGFSGLIILMLFLSAIANGIISSYSIFRGIRVSLFIFLMALICNNYLKKVPLNIFFNSLLVVLLINVICVYFQMIFPDTKAFFYSLFFTDKELKDLPLRAFGLYSSYDSTGLCICGLLLLILFKFRYCHKLKYFVLFLFVYLSVFFVSRYSMIIGTGLLLLMLAMIAKYRTRYFFLFIFPFLVVSFVYIIQKVLAYFTVADIRLAESYGASDEMLLQMVVFPDNFWNILIGTGDTIDTSDIGYVKLIYMMGIGGIGILFLFYWYTLSWIKNLKTTSIDYSLFLLYTIAVLFLLAIFNFKLLLMYSRGFSDLYIILILYLYSKRKDSLCVN